jgi:glycosyltransferase involved in cell wall biosynthesis
MSSGIKIVQLRGIGTGHQICLIGLMKTVRDEHPSIVHAQGYRNSVTDMASVAAATNGIPFVLTTRGSLLGFLRRDTDSMTPVAARLYDFVTLKQTLKLSSAVVVTCDQERRDAISVGIDAAKIRLIPHGMVFPVIPTGICALKGWPRILTVSRITPHRNIVDII